MARAVLLDNRTSLRIAASPSANTRRINAHSAALALALALAKIRSLGAKPVASVMQTTVAPHLLSRLGPKYELASSSRTVFQAGAR